jgi:AcrR family transcriptional regulator
MITQSRVIEEAIGIIDREGLELLSLKKLATELGVKAPSLYHHFRNKKQLLECVANQLLDGALAPNSAADELSWQNALLASARHLRGIFLRHPNATPLLLEAYQKTYRPKMMARWGAYCPSQSADSQHLLVGLESLILGSVVLPAAEVTPAARIEDSFTKAANTLISVA